MNITLQSNRSVEHGCKSHPNITNERQILQSVHYLIKPRDHPCLHLYGERMMDKMGYDQDMLQNCPYRVPWPAHRNVGTDHTIIQEFATAPLNRHLIRLGVSVASTI